MMGFLRDFLWLILLAAAVIGLVKVFTMPIRLILRLLWNGIIGLVLLVLFNLAGSLIGVTLGINAVSCLITGLLGIPGLLLLLLLKWLALL